MLSVYDQRWDRNVFLIFSAAGLEKAFQEKITPRF